METLSYKIESFEGPMDLLLHLISKHKVRIEDVPIMDLINQYLDYMKNLKKKISRSRANSLKWRRV